MKKYLFFLLFGICFLLIFLSSNTNSILVQSLNNQHTKLEEITPFSTFLNNFPNITTPLKIDEEFFKRENFSQLNLVSVADRDFYLVSPPDRPVSFGYQGDVYCVAKYNISPDVVVCFYFLDNFKEGMKGQGDTNFILFAASHRKSAKGDPIYITLEGINEVACVKNNGTNDPTFSMATTSKQFTIIQPNGAMTYQGVQTIMDKNMQITETSNVKGTNVFNKLGTNMINTHK